jgi:hypothetical protein
MVRTDHLGLRPQLSYEVAVEHVVDERKQRARRHQLKQHLRVWLIRPYLFGNEVPVRVGPARVSMPAFKAQRAASAW